MKRICCRYAKLKGILFLVLTFEQGICFIYKSRVFGPTHETERNIHMQMSKAFTHNPNNKVNGENGAFSLNGKKTQDVKVSRIGSRVLNPNQILYPSFFPFYDKYYEDVKYSTNSAVDDGSVNSIPLQRALVELKRCVQKLVNFESRVNCFDPGDHGTIIEEIEFTLGSKIVEINSDDNKIFGDETGTKSITIHSNENFFTIRIEQPISHPVDPLCWLHANMRNTLEFDEDPVMLYLADAEGSVEASVYGSSFTIKNLIFGASDEEQNAWKLIRNLPEGCKVYGASRFDKELKYDARGEEWSDFGNETWVLPAIELRKDYSYDGVFINPSDEREAEEKNDGGDNRMPQTTLSINLFFTSIESLIKSARNVLNLLQKVSHQISPPIPYTTLPPILARDFSANAQEEFEIAVDSALALFDNNKERASEDIEKVVLARRNDLHFGTNVFGLDLMMKLKFGGNIGGHLFYMNPGQSSGKEFLGCAPERLFQVRGQDKLVRVH